jgi:demethylmenaquinone methyltransferase / 2-methoxy-6-polyprenyl-1,4-benzoquinol methylase
LNSDLLAKMGIPGNKDSVRHMFDDISPKYDFLNHFLSFGIDRRWRKQLVRILAEHKPSAILDVASGTADLAVAMAAIGPEKITGIDISSKMLEIGKKKVRSHGLDQMITLQTADAEKLPFPGNSFDAVTVAFGVRNFTDLGAGLREMKRVLRPGGVMLILEFSHPGAFPVRQLYPIYSRFLIPLTGGIISGNRRAYRYLHDTVADFPTGRAFLDILEKEGMKNTGQLALSKGIASIYRAEK